MELTSDQQRLLRQRERTTDNIKWLIALVFAFSFTQAGQNVFKLLTPFPHSNVPAGAWHFHIITAELIIVFSITASVFYYQGTRHLDRIFATDVKNSPTPVSFIVNVGTIAITMVPFILMALSFDKDVVNAVGFSAFFLSYVLLIVLGLILLVLADLYDVFRKRKDSPSEGSLQTYWMMMNSAILIILGVSFWCMSRGNAASCPTKVGPTVPVFLLLFGVIAFARDALDFFWAWPFFFPVGDATTGHDGFTAFSPIPWIERNRNIAKIPAYVLLVVALGVTWLNHWPNYLIVEARCARNLATPTKPISAPARGTRVRISMLN